VRVNVTPQDEMRLGAARTVNPEAYEAYLQGRYYWNKRTTENVQKAIELFEFALQQDSGYAGAYAGLADAYTLLGSVEAGNILPREAMARAKTAALAALAIDDTLSDAHTSLAMIKFWYDWDWPGAEEQFQRALELNPGYATAHHWYAIYLSAMGRHDEALASIERAHSLDPLSTIILANVAWVQYHAQRYDEAVASCQKTLALDPRFIRAHSYLGMIRAQQGRPADAMAAYKAAAQIMGEEGAVAMMAFAHGVTGQRVQGQRYLDRLLERAKNEYVAASDIAQIYIPYGDYDQVLKWLERAYEERSYGLAYLKVHPRFDPLRSDPRFQKFLARMRFP
jgi:tetratricopeptide (TPR) repeat protein